MKRRNLILSMVLLAVAVAIPAAAVNRPTVKGLRYAASDDRTRVVIDLSNRSRYEIVPVSNPDRIAINIRGSRALASVKDITIAEGCVKRVRVNRLTWGAQVVLDLRRKATWSDFELVAVDNMPPRIVIDLFPKVSTTAKATTPKKKSRTARDMVVAVDAGHGGSDPGAIGNNTVEKSEALDIARRLAALINARPGFTAVMTRDRDVFIDLNDRSRVAKQKGADIFVSIHLNSAPNKRARGSEVFFLSPSGAEKTASRLMRNTDRAARELGVEGTSSADIVQMLVDVNQQQMMQRSELLAESIYGQLKRKALPPRRTIKQRSFVVLKSISMPSVMVETGFLTNSKDAKILRSASGKQAIAAAVADGVVRFLNRYPPALDETGRMIVHKVRKGDTLWQISRRYNTSVDSIQRTNKLGGSKTIRVGQELVIREGHATN